MAFGSPKNKASYRSYPSKDRRGCPADSRSASEHREPAAPKWRDTTLIFPNRVGNPMDHNNLYYREYKPLLKRARLEGEGFTFHSLRHTFATTLFKKREHPKVVQSLLGHSSITKTMDTYSHLIEGTGGDAVSGLGGASG